MLRSRKMSAIVLAVLTVYAAMSLAEARRDMNAAEELTRDCESRLTAAKAENERLTRAIESLGSDETIEALARERLGLVMQDEVIFLFF